MEYSILLARIFGIYLIIVCLAILINRKSMRLIFHAFQNEEVPFFSGFMVLLVGLIVVFSHNIWSDDFRIIITLMGWGAVLKGAIRLMAPEVVVSMTKSIKKSPEFIMVSLILGLLLGLYLTIAGFSLYY